MKEILILERILSEITERNHEEFVLFAKANYMEVAGREQDFVYHFIRRVPFKKLKEDSLLAVPVLDYEYSKDSDEVKMVIAEIYRGNPLLTTFAVRDRTPIMYHCKGMPEKREGLSLRFLDVCRAGIGVEVSAREGYAATNEDELKRVFGEKWLEAEKIFSESRDEINKKYL